jgi:UPF0042 nucleotide-binding protein
MSVTSFAYRNGIACDVDLIFDVHFLNNPYYVVELRVLAGRDPAVAAHIQKDAEFAPFFERLWQLLRPLLPRYETSGKTYLTIAIGCTGGRHRSAFVAGRLVSQTREAGWPVELSHRDLVGYGLPEPVQNRGFTATS